MSRQRLNSIVEMLAAPFVRLSAFDLVACGDESVGGVCQKVEHTRKKMKSQVSCWRNPFPPRLTHPRKHKTISLFLANSIMKIVIAF